MVEQWTAFLRESAESSRLVAVDPSSGLNRSQGNVRIEEPSQFRVHVA
jgi:hypothetical protein